MAPGSTEPLRFAGLSITAMRRGMEIGRYVWGLDCAPPYDPVHWTSGADLRRGSTIDARFAEILADTGFDVVGRADGPDAPGQGRDRARYVIQGALRDVRLELCHRNDWLTGASRGVSGSGSARVDWSVSDARSGQVVLRVTTSGVSRQTSGVPQGDILLIEEAVTAAADRLAADTRFRDTVRRGGVAGMPAVGLAGPAHQPGADPPSASSLTLAAAPVRLTPVDTDPGVTSGVASVAAPDGGTVRAPLSVHTPIPDRGSAADPMVLAGSARIRAGDGYGLVIGETQGEGGWRSVLVVPNPGLADSLLVRPAAGVTLTGTVEARDPVSGFALLRVPARLAAVPVRGGALRVSDRIRLVAGRKSATGIIAGLPRDPQRGVTVIQADLGLAEAAGARVEAGDPLLDAAGAVIGVALGPSATAAVTPQGLALFLPVGDLLARLGVDLLDGGVVPALPHAQPTRRGNASGAGRGAVEPTPADLEELDGEDAPPT
ncbi:S1C family serine protease [Azospirillum griseum]|uniref:Serine protease n=1 Tax=Azospirillum griseum TaxID=2496639 RepID=A0A3S0K678_9PROT|nr:S1C family serine protease [Azospirillum griseum]RTR21961.1 serine protease [Azospirillum griseum]